jgi:hypothetical protein
MNDFERWWNNRGEQPYATEYTTANAAFLAGMETQRKIDVEIAVRFDPEYRHEENCYLVDKVSDDIAADIENNKG